MNDNFPFQSEPWFEGFEHKTITQYASELSDRFSEKQIAEGFGLSIDAFRAEKSKAFNNNRLAVFNRIIELKKQGYKQTEIARIVGLPEPNVRYMLKHNIDKRASSNNMIAQILMQIADEKKMIDVGDGAELSSYFYFDDEPITRSKFKVALSICEDNGYEKFTLSFPQLGSESGNATKMDVLCVPGITRAWAKEHIGEVKSIDDYERKDFNLSDDGIPPVASIDSKRIYVRYAEDGGTEKDGCIELRPGLKDLSLGDSWYAQVRIAVDDKYFMKGVIIYSNHVPKGYDIVYNSNKSRNAPVNKVFKPLYKIKGTDQIDWSNPFKAAIKPEYKLVFVPRYYYENGERKVSPINVVYEMGDWRRWTKTLSPQFLSKQQIPIVKRQLNLTLAQYRVEFEELLQLTNPAVKKKMLNDFAEKCDSGAVELKAAPYPNQQYHVLVPFPTMASDRIYAPNYPDGQKVALIRYPHAGRFEIPILTVDNSFKPAKEMLKNAPDAVGINHYVAETLSGADFDGDSVTVIPITPGVFISTCDRLPGLINYEPKNLYPITDGRDPISEEQTQTEMGLITNLIADMQIMGAPNEDVEFAVKHSMTVIDANKHCLDHKLSERDNHIPELKTYYQGGPKAGARTAITRAGSRKDVTFRKRARKDNPETGEKIFIEQKRTRMTKDGEIIEIKKHSTKMYEAKDAYELLSGNDGIHGYTIEFVYCDFANELKQMANKARLEAMRCPNLKVNPSAKITFKDEIASLTSKLRIARMNAPRERAAQLYANVSLWKEFSIYYEWLDSLDEEERAKNKMSKDDKNKKKQQKLNAARYRFGAKTDPIFFTDREWLAINSGAVSQTMFDNLQRYADKDHLKQLATPRDNMEISRNKVEYILRLNDQGYPTYEIANRVGLSVSRVGKVILEEKL